MAVEEEENDYLRRRAPSLKEAERETLRFLRRRSESSSSSSSTSLHQKLARLEAFDALESRAQGGQAPASISNTDPSTRSELSSVPLPSEAEEPGLGLGLGLGLGPAPARLPSREFAPVVEAKDVRELLATYTNPPTAKDLAFKFLQAKVGLGLGLELRLAVCRHSRGRVRVGVKVGGRSTFTR